MRNKKSYLYQRLINQEDAEVLTEEVKERVRKEGEELIRKELERRKKEKEYESRSDPKPIHNLQIVSRS